MDSPIPEEFERELATITVWLERGGAWWLDGDTLVDYIAKRPIFEMGRPLQIGVLASDSQTITARGQRSGVAMASSRRGYVADLSGLPVELNVWEQDGKGYRCGNAWVPRRAICANEGEIAVHRRQRGPRQDATVTEAGVWRTPYNQLYPYCVCFPYGVGEYLDTVRPGWYLKKRPPAPSYPPGEVFYDDERKANAQRLLEALYRTAGQAGLADRLWLGFGGLLGLVREGDWIPHDNDIDMCVMPGTDGAAEKAWIERLRERGSYAPHSDDADHWRTLYERRKRGPVTRRDSGVPLWTSLGPLDPESEHGVKSCVWFYLKHGGYYWHSKGGLWVNRRKFNMEECQYESTDEAICLGMPERLLSDGLETVTYHGVQIRIPKLAGSCCDWWYPGWPVPRAGGSSAKRVVMAVGAWDKPRTWRVQ